MIESFQNLITPLGIGLGNFLIAILILVVGYILARLIASVIRRILHRINLDNRLAAALSEPDKRREIKVEDATSRVIFWLLMLFVLVAFFDRLGLSGIAGPITVFLEQLTAEYLPRVFAAGLLLFIAWLAATVLRFLVKKAAQLTKIDERLTKSAALEEEEVVSFGETISVAVYWFVLLLFLPAVLTALGITTIATSMQGVFDSIFAYIPNILGAVVILAIGWFVARVVREIVSNLLKAIGTDEIGHRLGLTEERSLSALVGMLVYIFIWLVSIITAMQTLAIDAIAGPTTQLLSTIINVIPNLIGAILLLVIAYAIARLVANLVRDLLAGVGFDSLPGKLGLQWSTTTPPSQWVGYLILVAIMLFAATSSLELLGTAALVAMLDTFIAFFWKVILAVLIFAVGLYMANLAFKAIIATGTNQANFMARMAQIAIVIFSSAIALREVGIANEIINLAFGISLGAIGLAVALSLGLGTTKISEREVDTLLDRLRGSDDGETGD